MDIDNILLERDGLPHVLHLTVHLSTTVKGLCLFLFKMGWASLKLELETLDLDIGLGLPTQYILYSTFYKIVGGF